MRLFEPTAEVIRIHHSFIKLPMPRNRFSKTKLSAVPPKFTRMVDFLARETPSRSFSPTSVTGEPVAAPVRPSAAWGGITSDLDLSIPGLGKLDHLNIQAIGVPEGIVVRGVCVCGGRSEVLVDGRPLIDSTASPESGEPDTPAMEEAARHFGSVWGPEHIHCGVHPRRFRIPEPLGGIIVQHIEAAAAALRAGEGVADYMGIALLDGADCRYLLTSAHDVPDVCAVGEQARREWLSLRQFGFREALRRPDTTGLATVCVGLSMRRTRETGEPRPPTDDEMAQDPRTEWSLSIRGVTRVFGVAANSPWGPRDQLARGLQNIRIVPLGEPLDVLDGVLALPLPRGSKR